MLTSFLIHIPEYKLFCCFASNATLQAMIKHPKTYFTFTVNILSFIDDVYEDEKKCKITKKEKKDYFKDIYIMYVIMRERTSLSYWCAKYLAERSNINTQFCIWGGKYIF